MTVTSPRLDALRAVAAATVDEHGVLVRANEGFRRLIEPATPAQPGALVAQCFIQPSFAALVAAGADAAGDVHHGLLTIGDYQGSTYTVRGVVTRDGALLHLLAEHDIAELERLNAVVLALNNDYAVSQRELAQANVEMQQLNARLEKQKAELEATLARIKRLEGLISICMYCKKMRMGSDDWQAIEQYVQEHTDATLSHGMCPECYAEQRAKFLTQHQGQP